MIFDIYLPHMPTLECSVYFSFWLILNICIEISITSNLYCARFIKKRLIFHKIYLSKIYNVYG